MSKRNHEAILKFYQRFPDACIGPSKKNEIKKCEDELKIIFSDEYKSYLEKYGGGTFEDINICGTKEMISMGTKVSSVVQTTNFYRSQNWPGIEDWYIISDDGFGNPIGIDPEGKVWLSDHDAGFEKVKLADSFEEFLYKVLTETLYE